MHKITVTEIGVGLATALTLAPAALAASPAKMLAPASRSLVAAAPATLTHVVTHDGKTATMRLTRQDLRGANFEVLVQDASGSLTKLTSVAEERAYLGTVDEFPDAVVGGIVRANGTFSGVVIFDRGKDWIVQGTTVTRTGGFDDTRVDYRYPGITVTPGQAGTLTRHLDVGFDVNSNAFANMGTVAFALEEVEFTLAMQRAMYMTNTLVRPYLSRVILRTSAATDPCADSYEGAHLGKLTGEWSTNQTSAKYNVVAGINSGGGGTAWLGGNFSVQPYAGGLDAHTWGYFRHEMGHNFGINHEDGGAPEGPTINSNGNRFARMSVSELANALNRRDRTASTMPSEGAYTAVKLPPYAAMDSAVLRRGSQSSVAFEVLRNDHDANGDTALNVVSFSARSNKGGTVARSGTGLASTLTYTPPANYVGFDWFEYVMADSTGQKATGVVGVQVQSGEPLQAHFRLDDPTGTSVVLDSSAARNHGKMQGATTSVSGKVDTALTFGGENWAEISSLMLNSNTVTLSGWIKRAAGVTQASSSGLIFNRSGDTTSGLHFGNSNELRYTWNVQNWGWNSGLVVPENQWVFVALVVEPTKATIYMHDGTTLRSAVNTASHAISPFAGPTLLGRDSLSSDRSYKGQMDDVRIYGTALSQSEVRTLAESTSPQTPQPPLKRYFKLDESTGATSAQDSSASQQPADLVGASTFSPGKFGNALTFGGSNTVEISRLLLNNNKVTLSAWIKRAAGVTQASSSGLIYNRSGGTTSGLHFGNSNELRYTWNVQNWGWNSGLVVPENQWVFVALVVEPTKATIYMHDGTTLRSAVNTAAHAISPFDGATLLGRDSLSADRSFKGQMDAVRLYDTALTSSEISALAAEGSASMATLKRHFKLDESTGATSAVDSSASQQNAALVGTSTFSPGKLGNALTFGGSNTVEISPLALNSNTVTLSGWIKRAAGAAQSSFSGLIFNRNGGTASGLNFGNSNELRYHWNNQNWDWNSGLVVPENQWVFVALVVEPTKATIYMHDGTTLRSAVNTTSHAVSAFSGVTLLGRDSTSTSRSFKGQMDNVRIHSSALSQSEVLGLMSQ